VGLTCSYQILMIYLHHIHHLSWRNGEFSIDIVATYRSSY